TPRVENNIVHSSEILPAKLLLIKILTMNVGAPTSKIHPVFRIGKVSRPILFGAFAAACGELHFANEFHRRDDTHVPSLDARCERAIGRDDVPSATLRGALDDDVVRAARAAECHGDGAEVLPEARRLR